jgi:uncharacterized protein
MKPLYSALLSLQELDDRIAAAEARLMEFEPQLREVEAPLVALRAEVEGAGGRLDELRGQVQRLEEAGEQKRQRLRQYEERLRVRNTREEASARIELDLIRRAVQADEQEAAQTRDQATRTDLRLDELTKQLERKQEELAPQIGEISAKRDELASEIDALREQRTQQAKEIEAQALRLYERVRSGRSRRGLAPLTDEGACGNCYNVLPVQEQVQIRSGSALHRCEACGVILYTA